VKVAGYAGDDKSKLVSPGVASNIEWLKVGHHTFCWGKLKRQEFMTKVKDMGIEPDYIAVHMYDTDADSFKNRVTQYYEAFGKPLWVTEFAMHVSCIGRKHGTS
jgi:hypothetical protein